MSKKTRRAGVKKEYMKEKPGKKIVAMSLDNDVVAAIRRAHYATGKSMSSIINAILRDTVIKSM